MDATLLGRRYKIQANTILMICSIYYIYQISFLEYNDLLYPMILLQFHSSHSFDTVKPRGTYSKREGRWNNERTMEHAVSIILDLF